MFLFESRRFKKTFAAMSEKRITMTLAEKKRYAEMIEKGAKKEVINRFFRQKHGQDIPKRTFSRLKNESKKILESTSKNKVRQKFKKSESMLKFEEKIKEEYGKKRMKSRVRGVTSFIRKIMNEHFADNEEIQRLKLSTELVTRIIRDCGKKTSKKTDRIHLSEEEKIFEIQWLRACRAKYPLSALLNLDETGVTKAVDSSNVNSWATMIVVENDHLDIKEEELVKKADEIFKNMNPAIFKRSWINTELIKEEEYKENVEKFEDLDVAASVLEKEEEEELVEHFLTLQIDETKAVSPMEVEEGVQVEATDEDCTKSTAAKKPSTSNWPKKQSKITSFFK